MMFHPTGGGSIAPDQLESVVRRNIAVHSLALACLPVLFLGALGIYRRLAASDRLSLAGLVLYGFALVGSMNAAIASGFLGSFLLEKITSADLASTVFWRNLATYNFSANQAFTVVFVVASCVAILLWSIATLVNGALSRGLGIYGCVLGLFGVVGILSGYSMSRVHGFGGLVFLGQSIWYIASGILLWNTKTARIETNSA